MISAAAAILVAGLVWQVTHVHGLKCAKAETVEKHLQSRYGEARVSLGVTTEGLLVERWESLERGTWTLLLRTRDGKLCVIGAGTGWRTIPLRLRGTSV